MLNNSFTLIGTAVTDFEDCGIVGLPKMKLMLEVEKRYGKAMQYPLMLHSKNCLVDKNAKLKGCTLIVNGYIDLFAGKYELFIQDICVVGAGKAIVENVMEEAAVEVEDD